MTGAETLRQVREALDEDGVETTLRDNARMALDGCILLTREEADSIAESIYWLRGGDEDAAEPDKALALLTPDPPQGDIEWVESTEGVC